jgi:hypothetical protein
MTTAGHVPDRLSRLVLWLQGAKLDLQRGLLLTPKMSLTTPQSRRGSLLPALPTPLARVPGKDDFLNTHYPPAAGEITGLCCCIANADNGAAENTPQPLLLPRLSFSLDSGRVHARIFLLTY